MQITLNGESKEIPDGSSAQQLIDSLGLANKRLAMEVNQEIVPRSTFEQHRLQEGDSVEIVHAIGGGQASPTHP
ncbi:MAG: sulfur carrier protein ThiS [Gammaproteobacteria bacterium]|nr:sulfur carrier protein ThiS [Gammaproteobacteria bacterium]